MGLLRQKEPLDIVRSLFYNGKNLAFLGSHINEGVKVSDKAEDQALIGFINYYEKQIKDVKEYLSSNREPNTWKWRSIWNPKYWLGRFRVWLWSVRENKAMKLGIHSKTSFNVDKYW